MATISITKTGEDAASKSLKVSVPVERVREAETRAVKHYAKRARLPGFRAGKAPEAVVRKRFGDAIRQSILEEVIRESWETAKTSESLKPINDPSIRNLKFEDGAPIEFDLQVEVQPTLKLDRIGGFTVKRELRAITDANLDEQLQAIREQKASWIPVEEGARPSPGQMVRVDVSPIEDGEAKPSQPYTLVLGQAQAIPELEERIMELTVGETKDVSVKFPDDHAEEARRGQTRQVRVTLHEVKRQELPPLDDALAREVGDFENLDTLKDRIRQDLAAEAAREADAGVRQALIAQIIEANEVPAPHSLVHRLMHGYAEAYKVPQEQFAAFEQQFEPVAAAQVQRDLILDALVEQHGLRASESEIDARIATIAESRNMPAAQVYATLQKSNRLVELERTITEEKAFAFLLGQSTVDEVTS